MNNKGTGQHAQSEQRLSSLSGEYDSWSWCMPNFNILASLCRWADWIEPYLVVNPKNKFFHDEAHLWDWSTELAVKRPLSKRRKIGFQYQLKVNANKSIVECLEHSVIHLTFIKLPFVIKICILSIFEWPFYTGFIVAFKKKYSILKKNAVCTYKNISAY